MAGPLDVAFVEIQPDFDKFGPAVKRGVDNASKTIVNNLTNAVGRAEKNMVAAGATIGENVGKTISDSTGDALASGLRRNAAGRLVDANGRFVSAAKDSGERIGESLSEGVGEGIDRGFKRDVNGKLRDHLGRFVDDGGRRGRDTGTTFGEGFGDGLSATLSSIAGIRLPVTGFAVFGSALAAAAASAVQLAAALAPAVGIITTLPAGIGVLTAGLSTLQVATLGVGDAFSVAATGSAEEFSEAMEGLAPNVQAAAQAVRDLTPEMDALRDSVQQAFFENFDAVLNQLAETLTGPVTAGMVAVAEASNGVVQRLTEVATSQAGIDFINNSFASMAQIVSTLEQPLAQLFGALLNVGNAIGDAFGEDAGSGLAGLISDLALFIDNAARSGQAVEWVNDALAVFSALGDIVAPIAGILNSIGEAAATTGGNILGAFGTALQVFDDFLASAQGQDILITIFEALNTVGAAFGMVLAGIAPAIPPIISGISQILGVVAPLLGPLSQLVGSVLSALAPVLGAVAAAIQPLIGPLTQVFELLGPILVEAITAVMPVVEALATLLGGALGVAIGIVASVLEALAPILTVVFEALQPVFEALQPLFDVLVLVADIIGAVLQPILQAFGEILLWIVENIIIPVVIPILENLITTLTEGLGVAIEWLGGQFELFGQGVSIVFNFVKEQITNRAKEMATAWEFLSNAFKVGWAVVNNLVFTPLKNGINTVKSVVSSALSSMRSGWDSFVGFIKGIPGKISSSLSSLFAPLASGFRSAINSVISGWNNLSFSIPSVNIPGLGTVGGGTINTPNIPYLARGALATGPTLAMVGEGHGPEAILPLEDNRVTNLLASALSRAGASNESTAGQSESAAVSAPAGGMNFRVFVGERELTDIVVEQIDESNRTMLRRARAGTRRNS